MSEEEERETPASVEGDGGASTPAAKKEPTASGASRSSLLSQSGHPLDVSRHVSQHGANGDDKISGGVEDDDDPLEDSFAADDDKAEEIKRDVTSEK